MYLTEKLSNCHDVAQAGFNKSGIFNITLSEQSFTHVWVWLKPLLIGLKFQVYCDLETDSGGWLVSFICIALLSEYDKNQDKDQSVKYCLITV